MSSRAQSMLARAVLTKVGPQLGIGGPSWTRARGSVVVTITGAVREARPQQQAAINEGRIGLNWLFTGATGQDLQLGDLLVSVADSNLAFAVAEPFRREGYVGFWLTDLSSDRFTSRATVQRYTVSQGSDGSEVISYEDDPQLTALPCVVREQVSAASEDRTANETVITQTFDILFNRAYPSIGFKDRLFVWPRQEVHNILTIALDPVDSYTALVTEIVNDGT